MQVDRLLLLLLLLMERSPLHIVGCKELGYRLDAALPDSSGTR